MCVYLDTLCIHIFTHICIWIHCIYQACTGPVRSSLVRTSTQVETIQSGPVQTSVWVETIQSGLVHEKNLAEQCSPVQVEQSGPNKLVWARPVRLAWYENYKELYGFPRTFKLDRASPILQTGPGWA